MNPTDKPRADSKLKTLPEERQAEMAEYALTHTLAETVESLKANGVDTSSGIPTGFRGQANDSQTYMRPSKMWGMPSPLEERIGERRPFSWIPADQFLRALQHSKGTQAFQAQPRILPLLGERAGVRGNGRSTTERITVPIRCAQLAPPTSPSLAFSRIFTYPSTSRCQSRIRMRSNRRPGLSLV